MSVNDLANEIRKWSGAMPDGARDAAYMIDQLARDAWHPVSQPPTEGDGEVLIYDKTYGEVFIDDSSFIRDFQELTTANDKNNYLWARIRDVVLLPEKLF